MYTDILIWVISSKRDTKFLMCLLHYSTDHEDFKKHSQSRLRSNKFSWCNSNMSSERNQQSIKNLYRKCRPKIMWAKEMFQMDTYITKYHRSKHFSWRSTRNVHSSQENRWAQKAAQNCPGRFWARTNYLNAYHGNQYSWYRRSNTIFYVYTKSNIVISGELRKLCHLWYPVRVIMMHGYS